MMKSAAEFAEQAWDDLQPEDVKTPVLPPPPPPPLESEVQEQAA